MSKVSSYGKVWALGHQQAIDVLDGPVVIQEKVDGSQFSFANINGDLLCRSKGQQIGYGGNCEGMFGKSVRTAGLIMDTGTLPEGMVVRGECLEKPKHNTISYGRTPIGNILIWDISLQDGSEIYLSPGEVKEYAAMWGMETVPTYFEGVIRGPELRALSKDLLERISCLGVAKIEGIVIKNYRKCDGFGKMMAAKIVADSFEEQNSENWKAQSHGSAIDQIIASFNHEAIWQKAIQHAKEAGVLLNEPKDIGYLIGAVKRDFHDEHGEAIKKKIFREFYSDIERGIMKGFPEWYKQKLADRVLEAVEPDEIKAN